MANKYNPDEIDESLVIASVKKNKSSVPENPERLLTPLSAKTAEQPEEAKAEVVAPVQAEQVKEVKEPVRRKRNNVDYSSMFLGRNEIKARSCVYISQRIHATISEIVRVIADKDVSVGGYIDNVLLQHLEAHKDEINDLYKKERKDLIEF
jgi:hypothetical protein